MVSKHKHKSTVTNLKLSKSQKTNRATKDPIIHNKLQTVVDEKGVELIRIMLKKKHMGEFKLAAKLNLKVNKVRSLLYKLYSKKIVSYTRKRDKRKGWYIYTWKLEPSKIVDFTIDEIKKDISALEDKYKISVAGKEFFICRECGLQLELVKALEVNYTCPYCNKAMIAMDIEKNKKEIIKEVNRLKKTIEQVKILK